jgi:hypothetical protein
MRRLATRLPALIAALLLLACGGEAADPAAAPADEAAADVLTLDWADLMPEGEEALLERIYDDYYRELEREMMSGQMPLSGMAGMDGIAGIEEGSALDTMPQLGTFNTIAALDGRRVRLPGFITPLDFESKGRLRNFLLVPYYGACIHYPPPPPNQIVFVEGEAAVSPDELWTPYWVEGTMHVRTVENDLGDAAYTLVLDRLTPYED